MKKLLIVVLVMFLIGCNTNLSKEEAEKLAVDKVCEVTSDNYLFEEGEPYAHASVYEEEGEKWIVIVYGHHSFIEVIVNRESVKVLPRIEEKYKKLFQIE